MAAKSYEVKHYAEDGRIYVVVTLDDDSTFGQYVRPGAQEDMDAEVQVHAARVEAQRVAPSKPAIGTVRMLSQATEVDLKE